MKRKWITYTTACTGCTETMDGQYFSGQKYDEKARCYVGSGCKECGYTGKRRIQLDAYSFEEEYSSIWKEEDV